MYNQFIKKNLFLIKYDIFIYDRRKYFQNLFKCIKIKYEIIENSVFIIVKRR